MTHIENDNCYSTIFCLYIVGQQLIMGVVCTFLNTTGQVQSSSCLMPLQINLIWCSSGLLHFYKQTCHHDQSSFLNCQDFSASDWCTIRAILQNDVVSKYKKKISQHKTKLCARTMYDDWFIPDNVICLS